MEEKNILGEDSQRDWASGKTASRIEFGNSLHHWSTEELGLRALALQTEHDGLSQHLFTDCSKKDGSIQVQKMETVLVTSPQQYTYHGYYQKCSSAELGFKFLL